MPAGLRQTICVERIAMHAPTRALLVVIALAAAVLARGHRAASASIDPIASGLARPADPAGPGVRIMTFNIQHGIDGSDKYHLQSAIDTIGRISPDLVALSELTRNHPYYNCDDQPKLIADGVSRATGRHWTWIYQRQWFTPNRECADSGRGDGRETEGLGFLAPDDLATPKTIELWNSGLGLATESPKLPHVPIVVTHLASQVTNARSREKQLAALLPWTHGLGAPRILLGDMNAWPEDAEMRPVFAAYRDAWSEAVKAGTARGRMDGITHKKHRIDYILFDPGGRLELLWAETVDTVPLIGKGASDHRPLIAAFALK
jgi:endonuclease/exonuclease/phosphatase family metal-dependent hydrolase